VYSDRYDEADPISFIRHFAGIEDIATAYDFSGAQVAIL
jgi:hypothetical protein